MNARYLQRGESIDHTPETDVAAGDVVKVGSLVGVAKLDIPANALGALALVGVYEFGVASGEEVAAGEKVYFNPATRLATKTAGGEAFAVGVAVAAARDGHVPVRFMQGA